MKTVMESILENCEKAMLARKPILLLQTNELEIVRRIIESDRVVARICRNSNQTLGSQLYRDAQNMPQERYLFRTDGVYQDRLRNVHTYSSLAEFAGAVMGITKSYGWLKNLSDNTEAEYPELFVVPANQDETPFDAAIRKGLYTYIDRYISEKDDNTSIASSSVILYGEKIGLPDYLLPYCAIIEEPYPGRDEIVSILENLLESQKMPPLPESLARRIAGELTGFRLLEVERLLAFCLCSPDENGFNVIYNEGRVKQIIADEKRQMLKKDQVLDIIERTENEISEIGGMNRFKTWLAAQIPSIRESQRFIAETGGRPCKGVLMCGVPGCGKSMAAQEVAAQSKLPLLRMEIGKLLGKYVGDSEHNMMKALKQAEAMAPCVLWIDEIEKGFSGSGDSGSDPTRRMFGTLLTWLQECRAPVFIFATANSITGMPKEFFRSGRFDALFSLYMPTFGECVDILQKQMQRVQKAVASSTASAANAAGKKLFEDETLEKEQVERLFRSLQEKENRYVTGADLEKLVNMALRRLWTGETFSYPIAYSVWKTALQEVLKETRVYGDGQENIDSIAVCYIRLLRNNFTSAADTPVFDRTDYVVHESADPGCRIEIRDLDPAVRQKLDMYDLTMRDRIKERMILLGEQLDIADRRKIIG